MRHHHRLDQAHVQRRDPRRHGLGPLCRRCPHRLGQNEARRGVARGHHPQRAARRVGRAAHKRARHAIGDDLDRGDHAARADLVMVGHSGHGHHRMDRIGGIDRARIKTDNPRLLG